jgi:hypothetical protein
MDHNTPNILHYIIKYIKRTRKLEECEDTQTCPQRTNYNNYTHHLKLNLQSYSPSPKKKKEKHNKAHYNHHLGYFLYIFTFY